jgi:hypothetical protein
MVERGILWTLTALFICGAAGRWQGPAGMIEGLRTAPVAAAVSVDEEDDVAVELAVLLERLDTEEAATFLQALPRDLADQLASGLPEAKRAAVLEDLR